MQVFCACGREHVLLTGLVLTVSWGLTSIFVITVCGAALLRFPTTELIPGLHLAQLWKHVLGLLNSKHSKMRSIRHRFRWNVKFAMFTTPVLDTSSVIVAQLLLDSCTTRKDPATSRRSTVSQGNIGARYACMSVLLRRIHRCQCQQGLNRWYRASAGNSRADWSAVQSGPRVVRWRVAFNYKLMITRMPKSFHPLLVGLQGKRINWTILFGLIVWQ